MLALTVGLLAQLPESTIYASPWKLVLLAVCMALWALFAQWVDKDSVAVNTFRILWNLVVAAAGVLAVGLLLFLPQFWAGLAAYAVAMIAVTTAYVLHRNGLVEEEYKVMTAAHLSRLMSGGKDRKKSKTDVRERVKLVTADRRPVSVPDDDVEREQYRLTQDILFDALWRRAGFLEIAPAGQVSQVSFRVDGVPGQRDPIARPEGDSVILYLKRLAGLSVEERRKPQRGKLTASVGENKFDLVIQTDGSTAGEKLTMRVVGSEKNFKIKDLGFTEKQLAEVQEIMDVHNGLTIFSAPPGNGLTTTMYSIARSHDAFLLNIQMLEHARELDVENITQKLHEPAEDRAFSDDLLRIVRSDPDVVVLPEVRDRKSAAAVAQAARGKQRVYVGLPAADLWDTVQRWITLVGDPKIAGGSLVAVVHQRLVRVLCVACRTPYKPDPATLRKLNISADKVLYRPPEPQYDKHGQPILCQACQGTGYAGRTGVMQILRVDAQMQQLIASGAAVSAVQELAVKQGIVGLQQQALQKVFEGVTSIEEVVRATRAPGKPAAAPAQRPAATTS